ncbi:MAG: glutathione synthase [Litorivicinus sp.]
MSLNIGILMDPIEGIKPYKDTSFAILLAAQKRGATLHYLTPADLSLDRGVAMGHSAQLRVRDQNEDFFDLGEASIKPLGDLDLLFIRTDPPFDSEYLYATQILDIAETQGVKVINRPSAVRDCNEKLFATWFPDLMAPTLVSRNEAQLRAFYAEHRDVIFKPLDGMGGRGIFRIGADGMNLGAVIESLTDSGRHSIMAQQYLPAIVDGDKRILMINGEPADYCLARIPSQGETRGNLAAGGRGVAQPLSDTDRALANTIGPHLRERGLYLVGLDVIGDRVTEINVTSPTCMREIDAATGSDLANDLLEVVTGLL